LLGVMAGLVPAIHALLLRLGEQDVDARDKRGHDDGGAIGSHRKFGNQTGPARFNTR